MTKGDRVAGTNTVGQAVERCLPGEAVVALESRGRWLRDIYVARTSSGIEAVVKVDPDSGSGMSAKEDYIARLLRWHGLTAPETLALDVTGAVLGRPFIVQRLDGGRRLGELVRSADRSARIAIYRAPGRHYRRLHTLRGERSGWIESSGDVLEVSPSEFQQRKVIVEVGAALVARGLLSPALHQRIVDLLASRLAYLERHVPSLVRGALHWTIYLDPADDFRLTKETDLHDYLWWDPAWDLASVRFPVFLDMDDSCWAAFLDEYGAQPDEQRLRLYRLMQVTDACAGSYHEPPSELHTAWRAAALRRLPAYVADAEES